jgi:hypothetical protein
MLSSSLSLLRALPTAVARSRQPGRQRPVRRKPCLETLEDRLVPATFNASALAADGAAGSLRAAVIAANSNGQDNVINLTGDTYLLTLTNPAGHESAAATGDLNLTGAGHTLVIRGAGPGQTFINAGQIDRAFQVSGNVNVVFRDLSIVNGLAQDDGTTGSGNLTADAFGGGILNDGGNVTLDNVHIANCEALAGPARSASGGGIYSSGGSLTLINSTLQGDTAQAGPGASGTDANPAGGPGGNGQGGGVYAVGTAVTLANDGFFVNLAGGGPGGGGQSQPGFAAAGGAAGAGGNGQGGGLYTASGTVAITDTTFESNTAAGSNGGQGGDATPVGEDNVPGGDGGAGGLGGNGEGGGVYVASGTVTIARTTLDTNKANGGLGGNGGTGGSSPLQGGNGGNGGNGGESRGGGLLAADGTVSISNATFSGNDASSTGGNGGNGGNGGQGINNGAPGDLFGRGGNGGISQGGGLLMVAATVNVHNSTVAANAALGTLGGAGGGGSLFGGSDSGGTGAGVVVYGSGTLRAVSSIFAGNEATEPAIVRSDVVGNFSLADHVLLGVNDLSNLAAANPDANGNIVGTRAAPVDPKLGPLQDNGGPTQTMALLPGSPAINAGSNPDGLATDQRGYFTRAADGGVDIGAFQLGATATPPPAPPTPAPPMPPPTVVQAVTTQVARVRGRRQLRVFDAATGRLKFVLYPFGKSFRGNYQVETRDVNGDGIMDVIVRAVVRVGRKRKTLTEVFSGDDGSALPAGLA